MDGVGCVCMCFEIEVSCFSVEWFIGCVWDVVVGLFFFVLVIFCVCCSWLCVVSIWLVDVGSGVGDVCGVGVDGCCICGGVIIVVGVMGVKDCCGVLGFGKGIWGWNVSVCSNVILMFICWFGVQGNFLWLINNVW